MSDKLFTIGYSGYPDVDEFISELKKYGIQILIDVRSNPYSAFFNNYNKDQLSVKLKENGIYYRNFAKQFGARQENITFYKNGRLDFEVFSESGQFLEGVHTVEKSTAIIAFMCAEKNPSECHRAILVAKAFSDRGHEIIHIIPNDITLTQKDIDDELLEKYFPNRDQCTMFDEAFTEEEYIKKAYVLRNDEIGFKLEDLRT